MSRLMFRLVGNTVTDTAAAAPKSMIPILLLVRCPKVVPSLERMPSMSRPMSCLVGITAAAASKSFRGCLVQCLVLSSLSPLRQIDGICLVLSCQCGQNR